MADDVLAVLDELGLERVKLVGHDWGGWIGFLLGIKAPERFSRYLALNILHPWIEPAAMRAPPVALLVPVGDPHAGARLPAPPRRQVRAARCWSAAPRSRRSGTRRRSRPSPTTSPSPTTPAPAVQVYRVFNLKESSADRGRAGTRQSGSRFRPCSSSAKTTSSCARRMLAGYQHHADEMRVELVPGCGHFIADERPELVAERAREFLA